VPSTSASSSSVIVVTRAITSNVATLTTAAAHGFTTGQSVVISGIDATFNGTYVIASTPTTTTFTYAKIATNVSATDSRTGSNVVISTKALTSNVATITTTTNHGYTTGQWVSIQGVDATFNGVYQLASASGTTFTYNRIATNVSSVEAGTTAGTAVTVKDLTTNVATISTFSPHGLATGDQVVITGVDTNLNGTYTVTATPTLFSFSYARAGIGYNQSAQYAGSFGSAIAITTGDLTTNVVTITTSAAHGLQASSWVTIIGANNNAFNGTYIITSVPTTTTFTFSKANANIASATINGNVFAQSVAVTNADITSNVATLTTIVSHGLTTGQYISVMGAGATYNGIYVIASTPTATTLTYTRVSDNIPTAALAGAPRIAPLIGRVIRRNGSANIVSGTSAVLAGTAASNSLVGLATVASPSRALYSGLVKKASDSTWRLFNGLQTQPTTTFDTTDTNLVYGDLRLKGLTSETASLSGALSVVGATTLSGDVAGSTASGYSNFNAKVNNLGTVTGSINVNVSSGPVVVINPIGNTTITFTNMPTSGYTGYWEVEVVAPFANTVTFNGVTWNGGAVPTLQTGSKKTVYTFRTRDGGSTIYGSASFSDIA
jgi:hypothetical protein